MKVVHSLNDEKSLFYYKKKFLNEDEYTIIRKWLECKKFCDGFCVSGKQIPRQQLWYQENGEYFCKKWINKYERWQSNRIRRFIKIQKKIQILLIIYIQLNMIILITLQKLAFN